MTTPLARWATLMLVAGLSAPLMASPEVAPAEMAPKAEQSLMIAVAEAGDRLVAVGSRGHILLSDDQGANWRQVPVPVNNLLTAVTFTDAQRGWVVGHDATILVTEDAGETWTVRQFDAEMNPLFDIVFFDDQRGLVFGGYGLAMETRDGGQTWQSHESVINEEGMHLNAVTQLNDGSYLIVGESGLMARSDDDGQSWTLIESPYGSSMFSVAAKGPAGAVVGGLRGNVFQTDDVVNGDWTELKTGSVQSVFGIAADGNGGFWLAGLNGSLLHAGADAVVSTPETEPVSDSDDIDIELEAATRVGGVAYADVLTLDQGVLMIAGGAGLQRLRVAAE